MSPSAASASAQRIEEFLERGFEELLYDSSSTSLGDRTQMGLSLFAVVHSSTCSNSFLVTVWVGFGEFLTLASAAIFFFSTLLEAEVASLSSTTFSLVVFARRRSGKR